MLATSLKDPIKSRRLSSIVRAVNGCSNYEVDRHIIQVYVTLYTEQVEVDVTLNAFFFPVFSLH